MMVFSSSPLKLPFISLPTLSTVFEIHLHPLHLFVPFFWFIYLLTWQLPPFLMISSCSPSFFSLPAMPTFCNRFFSLVCPPFLMSLSDIPPFKLLQFALLPSFEFSATICNVFCFWSPVKRAKLPQRVKRIGGFYCREWEKRGEAYLRHIIMYWRICDDIMGRYLVQIEREKGRNLSTIYVH